MTVGGVSGNVHSRNLAEHNTRVFEMMSHKVAEKDVPVEKQERLDIEEKQLKEMSPEKVSKVVESFNKVTESLNHQLRFEFDKDLPDQPIVKIVDKKSGKVVREIPPEEFVKMVAKMKDFLGALFDKKV